MPQSRLFLGDVLSLNLLTQRYLQVFLKSRGTRGVGLRISSKHVEHVDCPKVALRIPTVGKWTWDLLLLLGCLRHNSSLLLGRLHGSGKLGNYDCYLGAYGTLRHCYLGRTWRGQDALSPSARAFADSAWHTQTSCESWKCPPWPQSSSCRPSVEDEIDSSDGTRLKNDVNG
jgi:hypothetical protein